MFGQYSAEYNLNAFKCNPDQSASHVFPCRTSAAVAQRLQPTVGQLQESVVRGLASVAPGLQRSLDGESDIAPVKDEYR